MERSAAITRNGSFAVALVYPPYGPAGIPSLGLALLAAGIKQRGFTCRTFYWNLDFVDMLPGDDLASRLTTYRFLTHRPLMPFNEWVFGEVLHGRLLADQDEGLIQNLEEWLPGRLPATMTANDVLTLRSRAPEAVGAMADQLAHYDLIGINSTFFQNVPALALAKEVKLRWPAKLVVLGGANCDGEMGPTLFEQYPFLDSVFVGEVDHAFPEFVARVARGEEIAAVPGMLFRQGNEIRCGPPAVPLQNMDELPIPDFDDYVARRARLGMDSIHELCLPLESSRGCWWGAKQHCTFCGLNANGMGYRQKSMERFGAEVRAIVQRYGARYLFMTDNILSMNYYHEFVEGALPRDVDVNYFYEIKANVTRKHAAQLAHAGVTMVQPGIESFSSRVLQRMSKGTTGIRNVAFLRYAREYGILATYNLLAGFPGEEPEEYARMAEQVPDLMHLQPPSALLGIEYHRFSPYHSRPADYGIRLRVSPRYRYIYPFAEPVLERLAYLFERCDAATLELEYLNELSERIVYWQQSYHSDDCALVWQWAGGDIRVDDRRPGRPAQLYRLRGFAVPVFRWMDEPIALKGLIQRADHEERTLESSEVLSMLLTLDEKPAESEQVLCFSREEFCENPTECMARFTEAHLVYVEGDRYLALPVMPPNRVVSQWLELGV